MKRCSIILLSLIVALAATGAAVVYSGAYDVSATDQHLPPTYRLLDLGMDRSVKRRAADIEVPELSAPALVRRGAAIYRLHCVQCHGGPGVAPEAFALGMTPVPASLVQASRDREVEELYWIVRHGLKMTGMPAWEFRLPEGDLWAVVAFLRGLPALSPAAYQALMDEAAEPPAVAESGRPAGRADPARGQRAVQQYGCATCHRIPGITGPRATVGPPLEGIAARRMLAGTVPNTEGYMVQWLQAPQSIKPQTAMPDLGVKQRDARDIAAYLFTLR